MKNWTSMLIALVLTAALCLGAVPGMAQGVLTLPSAMKEIQAEAFKGAKGVSEIVLPEGVETIGERAFAESSIEKINLPRSVERIADDAFEGCDALTIYGETGSYAQTFAKEQGIPFVSEEEAAFEYVVVNGGARVTGYTGGRTNVVVPETLGGYPVTAMERAFDNNDEIMTVVLPSTLKTLGGYTFWGCDNLRRVTFNSDITAIGDFEFFQCRVLEDFMLPESVTSIGMKAFSGCRALTKLPFGGHVQTIGNYAFEECWGFTGVDIPDGVKTIGANAFSNGQFLTNIVIPASVTSIGSNAFSGSLYEMTIYGYAGTAAETYAQSKGIAFVDLGAQVPAEFTYATNEMGTFITGYTGAATTVVVPAMIDGVKMDGVWHNAFKGNTLITSVTLQEGLAMIGGEAFRGCTALERVNLPESLTAISAGAFRECSALQTIALPDNAQLGWGVFYGCSSLESVTLPANLTEIPSNAFRECSLLISAPIPAGVTKIDEYAFYACHNLRGVEIPAGVTEIGAYAFDNCEMIEEIVLPEALETLGSYAFYSAGSLQRVEFNSDITEIGEFTFFQCVNLKDIQLPASVTNIGASAFVGCNGLTALPFGEGVVTIGERAFADCYYLAEIEIPETVTSIGARAFSFCYDLKKATIPATVTEIGEMAFWNNDESFTIHGYTGSAAETFAKNNDIPFVAIGAVTPGEPDDPEIEETPAASFSYMIDDGKATILQFIGSETDVVIPAKIEDCPVTSVNSGAFYGAAVESVVFPESVWEIGEYCFSLCERLESVTITAATETIGANIFNECPDVTVYGAENSYAHLYAQRWGVPFVATSHLPARTSSYYLTTDGDEATILFYTGSVADLVIPDNIDGYTITGIGNYAFTDVDGLTKITLPSTLKVIGKHAFSYTGLKEIEIPDGVFNIGPSAFRECYSLTKATIPASVTNITSNAFRDCGDNFTIYGYTGSRAESFAGEQNYLFVALDGEPQDPEGEQTEGDYTYTVENGKATIVAYAGSDADVVIPAALGGYPVEKIGEYAFEAKTMTTVIIPEGVTEIGMGAFYWCESLRAAAIPASIANIGDRAFSNCHTDLIITGTAGTIAQNHAWENAIGFADAATGEILFNNDFAYTVENGVATLTLYTGDDSELVVPAQYDGYTVGALRWGVLQQCDTLTKVTVEARVPEIPRAAFQNCDLLVEVTLPDSVTSIAANAFRWCYALKDVYIPASVTSIDATAFDECPADLTIHGYAGSYAETYANENGIAFAALGGGEPEEPEEPETPAYTYVIEYNFTAAITGYTGTETELVLPEELGGYPVGFIGSYAFENRADLTKITLPSTLGRIGVGAFAGCTGLTEMTIPAGVKEIADSAFWGCTGLQEIEFPGSVTSIGGFAFASCSGLTKATIPASVTSIGERAFYECAASFAIHGYTGSYAQTYAQNNGHPFVALDAPVTPEPTPDPSQPYEENGYTYYYLPEEQAVSISSYSGSDQDLVIPSTLGGYPVVQIGMHAFSFKDTLRTVTIPYGVKRIQESAIKSCPNLTSVSIPESVTELGGNVFAQCPALTSVNLPSGLTALSDALFEGCSALESIEIPAGVESIGEAAFYACTSLKRADIPAGVVSIGSNAFANCWVLQNVTIPQGVTRIEEYAFYTCDGLTQISIPETITYIAGHAFEACDGLTSVTIPAQVTELGDYAFYGCTKLESVTIENPALVFGANAFDYFYKLTIYGYTGSTAQAYASANGAAFVALDGGSGEPDVPVVPPAEELEFDYFCDGYTVTIEGYNGSDTNIVIPAAIEGCPVTEISSYAFQFNTALTSVVIPDSVEILGDSCFDGCSALASVSLGSGLKQIGMNAFSGCTALTGLTLPEGLEMIGEAAFISSGLTEITVPKSVYQLGANAFRYNYAMTEATIKGDLGYLSDFAFIGNTALRKVTITGGVSAIGEMAFGSCSALEEITIPASVTQIADNAFSGAAEDFTIYGYYGSYAQTYAVMHGYTFIVLEAGPVTPEEPEEPEEPIESFYTNGYTYILRDGNAMIVGYNGEDTKPVVPDTLGDYPVAAIEERAFKGTAISEITLPESLTHIGPYVFEDCEQLYRVKVLSRTMTFDEAAFHGTSAYLTILCYSDSTALAHAMEMGLSYSLLDGIDGEYTDGEWSWTVENGETTITKYTGTAQEIYLTEMIMGSPIVAIGESAFASNKELVKIVFPDTLRLIGKQAFKSCSKLQEIELPDSVTGLGTEEAFAYCSGLKSVKLSAGLTAISTRAFRGCTSLTSIVIPEGVKQIGTNAFYDCRNLKSVTLPESLRGIYLSAFRYCSSLTEIRIPDGVSMIDSSAFSDCTKLAKVTLPKNLTSIEGNTFKNCTALTSIELPISLTNIGTYAFSGSGLTEIDIPGNVTSIGTYAFSDCTNLTDIAVPNGVAQIMDGFAKGCTALTSIDLLDGVTSIGHYAFSGCTAMWGATIPQTVTSIGEYVFDGTAEDFAIFGYEDSYAQTYALEKGLTFVALGRDETLYTDFDYVIEDGEVCITQYNGSEAEVVVPYVIEGYQVTKIGELAFFGLDHITSVKIPSSVIDIGHQAFSFCGNLTNVEIPAAAAEIYEDAFQCSHHALVITGVKDSTACAHALAFGIGFRDAATGEVLFDNDYGYTVIDGEVRINAYTGIEKDVIVPSVIEGYPVFELGAVAMMRNDYMISLTVPSSVRMINGAMAQYCYNLEEIHLSEGLECIYDGAFRGCDSLSRIIIPESVIRIGDRAFHGCSMLASATIPAGVTNIGEDVFAEVAEGFTIYGYSGSAAEAYAAARSIPFVALDAQLPEVETLEAICPWSAGSVSDSVLRAFGAALVNEAGVEQVTYSNLTGAGGVIGHQAIADAQADGKALGMITTELSMYAPMNTASLTYASVDPLCIFSVEAAAVLVNAQWAADNGITDMSSFIAYCTANPASVRMAVSSTGSVWHVAGGYLEKKTGVDLALMNYASGAAASIQNAAMGMDHGVITSLVNAAPFLNSGDLICLGVMGTERDDFYPAYETCTEQGYALVYGAWRGIAAPQGLSASMKAALEASCRTAAQSESFAAAMAEMGCNQTYMGADEAKQFLAQNYADTYEVIVALGL